MAKKSKIDTPANKTRESIEAAYREALSKFGKRDNVTGVDIGFKYVDGKKTGKKAIRLHVKEKLPPAALEAAEAFPEEINGFPVDVIQANYKAGAVGGPSLELLDRTARFSKIQPGISIGHPNVTAGTLGLIVRDDKTGKPAILSNWHILVGDNTARAGDSILQPGRFDGGRAPRDIIAKLERMILDNDGDAAIAILTNDRPFDIDILDLGIAPNQIKDADIGDIVVKSGRTTEVTKGMVEGKGRYNIDYSIGTVGIDGFRITSLEEANPANTEISKGGDSGAGWLLEDSNTLVGLHFAGETDPRPEEEFALACHASAVFSRLSISLLDNVADAEITFPNITVANNLAMELGKVTVSNLFNDLDQRQIRTWAKLLDKNYPRLLNGDNIVEDLDQVVKPEIGSLGLVAVGFAVGAVSQLINKQENKKSAGSESFSLAVSAFLAGALAGTRAVDGRL